MTRGVKKENLPTKVCVICKRPFNWRKKWERCWDEVTTCSKSCNRTRREIARKTRPESIKNTTEENTVLNSVETALSGLCIDSEGAMVQMIGAQLQLEPSVDANIASVELHSPEDCSSNNVSCAEEISVDNSKDAKARARADRKAAKKANKAARRAQREGRGDPTAGQKKCDMCGKSVNLLIRCTYDASGDWKIVCGKCWNVASGGVDDGDAQHPHYRYGGLWKNRRAR